MRSSIKRGPHTKLITVLPFRYHLDAFHTPAQSPRQLSNDPCTGGLTFQATDITLKEFLGEWLTTVSFSNSKGTYFTYSWTVEKRILPYIGNVNLMDLRPDRIQRFYNHLQKEGLSHHAVAVTHKTLRVAMNHAVNLRLIGRNPCSGTTPPRPQQTEVKFYDDRQARSLLKTARDIEDKFYPLYYLAIHTGMRQAELIGVKWEDIDWNLSTLRVKRRSDTSREQAMLFWSLNQKVELGRSSSESKLLKS